jgi:hypothetical protein
MDLVSKGKSINSDDVLSGIVLKCTGQESLWEEESGNPENFRCTMVDPVRKESNTVIAILNPRGKRLK